jgi:hypothetical protein
MKLSAARMKIEDFLFDQLGDARSQWSTGTFGAIAEFSRLSNEDIRIERGEERLVAVTERGGIALRSTNGVLPFASESIAWQGWSQRVALCLSKADAQMNGRSILTELSNDDEALRTEDRGDVLFDLGLAAPHVDFCIRVGDAKLKALLRERAGEPLYKAGNPALAAILESSPHRVFVSRLCRIEVYQRIPTHGEVSPLGPHTHVLPKLLKQRRTHAATEPMPDGMVPCAHVYPWHPADVALGQKPSFHAGQHRYLQDVLRSFGDQRAVSIKDEVISQVKAERDPPLVSLATTRIDRANVRIALRQLKAANCKSRTILDWISEYDRVQYESNPAERPVETCGSFAEAATQISQTQ